MEREEGRERKERRKWGGRKTQKLAKIVSDCEMRQKRSRIIQTLGKNCSWEKDDASWYCVKNEALDKTTDIM